MAKTDIYCENHNFFQNFWGPFLGPQGLLPSIWIPLLPLRIPICFPTCRPFFLLPSSGDWEPWWLLNLLMIHFIYSSKKYFFKNFFGALFGDPRGSRPPFSNSPSPATYPHIFSDVSTSIPISFFTVVPKGLTAGSKVHVAVKLTTYYYKYIHTNTVRFVSNIKIYWDRVIQSTGIWYNCDRASYI